MYVIENGGLSDFELLIHVFPALRCRCESWGIATRPFIILYCKERRCLHILSASGFQPC